MCPSIWVTENNRILRLKKFWSPHIDSRDSHKLAFIIVGVDYNYI